MSIRVFPVVEDPPFDLDLDRIARHAGAAPPCRGCENAAGNVPGSWDVAANCGWSTGTYLDFSCPPVTHAADIPASIRSIAATSASRGHRDDGEMHPGTARPVPPTGRPRPVNSTRTWTHRRTEIPVPSPPRALHLRRWDVETPAGETLTTTESTPSPRKMTTRRVW